MKLGFFRAPALERLSSSLALIFSSLMKKRFDSQHLPNAHYVGCEVVHAQARRKSVEEEEHGEGHDRLDRLHVRHARLCGHALVGHGHPHVDEHGAGHQQSEATDVGAVKRNVEGQVEDLSLIHI